MEKGLIVINLSEAKEQLDEMIKKLKNQKEYDISDLQLDIQHVMMHINTAYNIKDWSAEQINEEYKKKFNHLIRVPEDKYLIDQRVLIIYYLFQKEEKELIKQLKHHFQLDKNRDNNNDRNAHQQRLLWSRAYMF